MPQLQSITPEGLTFLPDPDIRAEKELLVAACWAMWASLAQAWATDRGNEALASLYSIARDAMIRAGQLPDPCDPNK